jgi:hypothetical protein
VRLMMSKSKSVARKIIVPSGQLSAGGHTRGQTSQISSTSSWPTMQRRAPSAEERRVRGSRRKDSPGESVDERVDRMAFGGRCREKAASWRPSARRRRRLNSWS